jgi:hypothetical protein
LIFNLINATLFKDNYFYLVDLAALLEGVEETGLSSKVEVARGTAIVRATLSIRALNIFIFYFLFFLWKCRKKGSY